MRISNKCQIFVKGSYAEQKATQAMKQLLSEKQIKSFNNEGFLIIKNYYDIKRITKIQEKVYTIIGELMDEQRVNDNRERFNGNNFDQHFNKLIELNRFKLVVQDLGGECSFAFLIFKPLSGSYNHGVIVNGRTRLSLYPHQILC